MPFDVLVVGELNVDLIMTGDVEPAFGQVEKLVDSATLSLGSSSGIFACGAARLGLRVAFIGKIGEDTFGHFLLEELAKRGVDTRGVVIDPEIPTGITLILSRGADRAILTYPGTISALRYNEIDQSLLSQARHLHLGSYFMLDNLKPHVPHLFDAAHSYGMTVSLDTNFDPTEAWNGNLIEALHRADIFLPNEAEIQNITRQPSTEAALEHMVQIVPAVVVKMGAAGAMARVRDLVVYAEAPAVKVVDTVGAGDSFDAGFIYGHLAGWELKKTLQFATICGSLSTQGAGGIAAQPTFLEAIAHL